MAPIPSPDGGTSTASRGDGTADEMREQIGQYEHAGVSHLLLDITARGGVSGRHAAMERFAAEVMGC